ncbi:MAG: sigma-70 family RNA polymerase sigma factor [Bacteroidales bacterium]|jgi:RNA polymerase sigma-70 factor (ECF subfamily)|nr:sigma-70 family RNA polymerase sigma factor [Bacteroidales bacterium]
MGDNEKLIRKCQQKSRKAFEELYRKFSPFVYGICLRYAKNRDEAQDILQECFIKVMERIGEFRFEGSFEGWLQRMVVNESLNYLKVNKNSFSEIDEEDADAEDVAADIVSDMTAKELLDVISRLPDGYRTIFNLYVIEGYQHNEIAEILNITESTSRSQLKKAREQLIDIIRNEFKR